MTTSLGEGVVKVRKTNETPPRISFIDVATLVTGKNASNAARDVAFVQDRHPEVSQKLNNFLFPGRGQRNTPLTNCPCLRNPTIISKRHH